MDDWGDPWANDADPDATPPKPVDVAITNKPVYSTTPVLLNSFLDDAQWGSAEEEGFGGGWETSSGNTDPVQPTHPDAREADSSSRLPAAQLPDSTHLYQGERNETFEVEDEGWGSLAYSEEALKGVDNIISENSDSATTIQPDDDPTRVSSESVETPHLDDEISTLYSTSPSEVSHAEAPPIESPRTSSEDERIAVTALETHESPYEQEAKTEIESVSSSSQVEPAGSKEVEEVEEVEEDDFGDFEENIQEMSGSDDVGKVVVMEAPPSIQASREKKNKFVSDEEPGHPPAAAPAGIVAWKLDQHLMDQLFPTPVPSKELSKALDEPISTTSTRKTWYRLTRKPTMREYNTGMDNDNYVRVTWANSHIRAEAKKIVVRWTAEDRNSGRGRSSGASFYWDQYSSQAPNTHVRKKSTISDSGPTRPAEKKVRPLSTNVPAAFNWSSSPLAADDPWRLNSPDPRPIASPVAAKHSAVPDIQGQASRPVSIDLTPQTPALVATSTTTTLDTPKLPISTVPDHKQSMKSDPREGLSNLDTSSLTKETDTTFEEDDDWGEMVVSPTVSTIPPTAHFSPISSHDQTFSTPSTTPKTVNSSPSQPPASRHSSPIVRLKSIVSPTSSAFQFNSFVPVGTEVEPIGQNVLKKSLNKATDLMLVKEGAEPTPTARTEETFNVENQRPVLTREETDDFSAFKSSIAPPKSNKPDDSSTFKSPTLQSAPAPEPVPSESPPFSTMGGFTNASLSAPSAQAPIDAWSNTDSQIPIVPVPALAPAEDPWSTADFSFFESATPAPAQPHNPLSPSDPWSIFNTPVPNAPLAHRDPPRATITPSPNLSYDQRRKAEEDGIVAEIMRGLPDLRYMLR